MTKRQFSIKNEYLNWNDHMDNLDIQSGEISALKSFYENTNDLCILEEASAKDRTLYTIEPITIELWLPFEAAEIDMSKIDDKLNVPIPILERSISGRQAHTRIQCEYLPPLTLTMILPASYPSNLGPEFKISSSWLNMVQIEHLCDELDKVWLENGGTSVIYTFVDWLQNNTLDTLDIFGDSSNSLIVCPTVKTDSVKSSSNSNKKSRAISEYKGVESCIFNLIKFNMAQQFKIFRNSVQECSVCFQEKMGTEFIKLNDCKHFFCFDCLSEYCKMHVTEGTVNKLKCPESDCTTSIPNDVMEIVLSKEEFERWDRLTTQRELDLRSDILYCPRCSEPVKIDTVSTHTFCEKCNKDFCQHCKEAWHIGKCKTVEEKFNDRLKDMNLNVQELLSMSEAQIKHNFKHYDFVFKMLDKLKYEEQVKDLLNNFLRCPKCHKAIEKSDGCNKVTCFCGAYMCYQCGREIDGYDHFDDNDCKLWPGNDDSSSDDSDDSGDDNYHVNYNAYMENLQRKNARPIIICPTCGNRSRKQDTNNHKKCNICGTNYCCMCKQKIIGVITVHYKNSDCKQHS